MRHINLTCKNHRELRWNAKSIAVNSDGSYNGTRSIFFQDWSKAEECKCPSSDLTFASPEDEAAWKADI